MSYVKDFLLDDVEKQLKKKHYKDLLAFYRKCFYDHRFFVSLRELCVYAGLDVKSLKLNPYLKSAFSLCGRRVMSITGILPTYKKHSVVCAMYDDTDDDIRWACRNGAIAIICDHQVDNLPCIVVENPLMVYSKMCEYYRSLRNISVTAVTGSIGKTTVKRMLGYIYSREYETFVNMSNYNILSQVGYFCQHIPENTQKLVQEVSEDTPGCVAPMSLMLKPHVAIITSIDVAHIEAFGSAESIADECCSIVAGLDDKGVVVVNMDEFSYYEKLSGHIVRRVSLNNKEADYYADDVLITQDGIKFTVCSKHGERYAVCLKRIYAVHNVMSALMAFVAAVEEGISVENIVAGLEDFKMSGVRQNLLKAENGTLIYADCYNAVPKSIKSALEAIKEIPFVKKRIAVLGDIGDTGDYDYMIHAQIAEIVNDAKWVDTVIVIGKSISYAFRDYQFDSSRKIIVCDSIKEALPVIMNYKKENNIILFKASHFMNFLGLMHSVCPELSAELEYNDYVEDKKWGKKIYWS